MFVRPPIARSTRNPGRHPGPPRMPVSEINRPLLRQFVRNRRADPRYEAYILEVREGPAINGNTNAATSKSIPQPWVTIRDYCRGNQSIGLPVSICDTLLTHLLTCVSTSDVPNDHSDVSGELACSSPGQASDNQPSSPAGASGDARSPNEQTTSETDTPRKSPSQTKSRLFKLTQLKPIRIVCEATGCTLEVSDRDPLAKNTSKSITEEEENVQVDHSRRWIISTPSESRPITTNKEASTEINVRYDAKRIHPWEARGNVELHGSLMTQLAAFLTDVVTRYRLVTQLPEVRSLYSASGGRRFFFDLRDTRWGKRLHISQVTDLHRNVIGIPLEALVSFRTRLDTIIRNLGLEDQHALRSEISSGDFPIRGQPRAGNSPRGKSSQDESKQWGTPQANGHEDGGVSRRGRDGRRQRMRSFTTAKNTVGNANQSGELSDPNREQSSNKPNPNTSNSSGAPTQINNGHPRNRRFARRNRYQRPYNRMPRPLHHSGEDTAVTIDHSAVQSAPEPAIDRNRVTAVAEASA